MAFRQKIGLYSGAFDPIHEGHVSFALAALDMLDLQQVILLPERQPRAKIGVSSFEARLSTAQSVLVGYPRLTVRALDGTQHTTETVRRELYDIFAHADVTLLMGSDVARKLQYWDGVASLLRNHELCIGLRNNESADTLQPYMQALEDLHGLEVRVTYITTKFSHLSSTAIRHQTPQHLL